MNSVLGVVLVGGVAAFIAYTIRANMAAKRREQAMVEIRGEQTATEFAALFTDASERRVAELLYPRLQSLTLSERVPFRPDDLIFEHLEIDDEDLTDEILDLLRKLRHPEPNEQEWNAAFGGRVRTVGDVVSAVTRLTETVGSDER